MMYLSLIQKDIILSEDTESYYNENIKRLMLINLTTDTEDKNNVKSTPIIISKSEDDEILKWLRMGWSE